MRSWLLVALVTLSMVVRAQETDTLTARHPEYLPGLELGALAPEIEARDTLGNVMKLSDLRGNYVVLDFWATWCGDCRREIPGLRELYAETRDQLVGEKRIQWLGFSFDDKEQAWRDFLRREQMPWPQISNLKRTRQDPTFQAYELHWIPALLVLDPEGKIVGKAITAEGLKRCLQEL